MNGVYDAILELIRRKEVVVSNHGYDEMVQDGIFLPSPAVLVTSYRPDPDRWSADFSRRLA